MGKIDKVRKKEHVEHLERAQKDDKFFKQWVIQSLFSIEVKLEGLEKKNQKKTSSKSNKK